MLTKFAHSNHSRAIANPHFHLICGSLLAVWKSHETGSYMKIHINLVRPMASQMGFKQVQGGFMMVFHSFFQRSPHEPVLGDCFLEKDSRHFLVVRKHPTPPPSSIRQSVLSSWRLSGPLSASILPSTPPFCALLRRQAGLMLPPYPLHQTAARLRQQRYPYYPVSWYQCWIHTCRIMRLH